LSLIHILFSVVYSETVLSETNSVFAMHTGCTTVRLCTVARSEVHTVQSFMLEYDVDNTMIPMN